uniref:Major facilitator superfamily (MFS) profile domain-containing protein n=1 Tax=Acrobeloides nanus TaxID=290746 RepID=A0A914DXI8_9BILA
MTKKDNDPDLSDDELASSVTLTQSSVGSEKSSYGSVSSKTAKTDWRSIYVAMSLTFVSAVQFSLYFSSLWPFLNIIDSTADETFFGYIVAIYSFGQIIASPLTGFWSNKIKQITLPLYIGLGLMFVGNAMYLSIELVPSNRKYLLLFGRFITGLGSSNVSLLKAYASTASTFKDRSRAIAFVTGGLALGMTCGPGNRIGTPLSMSMFSFTKAEVVRYTAMAQAVMGFFAFSTYVLYIVFNLGRFVNQRLLSVAMLFFLILFHVLTYSWPFLPGHIQTFTNAEANKSSTELVGCNVDKLSWCDTLKPVNVWLYYVSYCIIIGTAFPNLNISLNTLFSQIIGPRRQGTQQGILQMSGGAARMIGPLIISVLYTYYGPRMAWNAELVSLTICLISWLLLYKRMVPLKIPKIEGFNDFRDEKSSSNEKDTESRTISKL